jgi:hypothetical protein
MQLTYCSPRGLLLLRLLHHVVVVPVCCKCRCKEEFPTAFHCCLLCCLQQSRLTMSMKFDLSLSRGRGTRSCCQRQHGCSNVFICLLFKLYYVVFRHVFSEPWMLFSPGNPEGHCDCVTDYVIMPESRATQITC